MCRTCRISWYEDNIFVQYRTKKWYVTLFLNICKRCGTFRAHWTLHTIVLLSGRTKVHQTNSGRLICNNNYQFCKVEQYIIIFDFWCIRVGIFPYFLDPFGFKAGCVRMCVWEREWERESVCVCVWCVCVVLWLCSCKNISLNWPASTSEDPV